MKENFSFLLSLWVFPKPQTRMLLDGLVLNPFMSPRKLAACESCWLLDQMNPRGKLARKACRASLTSADSRVDKGEEGALCLRVRTRSCVSWLYFLLSRGGNLMGLVDDDVVLIR